MRPGPAFAARAASASLISLLLPLEAPALDLRVFREASLAWGTGLASDVVTRAASTLASPAPGVRSPNNILPVRSTATTQLGND
jgi:hypothetical protein